MLARRRSLAGLLHHDAVIGQHWGMKRNKFFSWFLFSERVAQAGPNLFPPDETSWSCMNHRAAKLALISLGFTVFFLGFSVKAHAQSASHWYKEGQNAEAKDDIETAYEDYYKAYQKDPKDLRYKT